MKLQAHEILFKCERGHTVNRWFNSCPTLLMDDGRLAVEDPNRGRPCGARQNSVTISTDAFERLSAEAAEAGCLIQVDRTGQLEIGTAVEVRVDCTDDPGVHEPAKWGGWYGKVTHLEDISDEPNVYVTMDGTLDKAVFFENELIIKRPAKKKARYTTSPTVSWGEASTSITYSSPGGL